MTSSTTKCIFQKKCDVRLLCELAKASIKKTFVINHSNISITLKNIEKNIEEPFQDYFSLVSDKLTAENGQVDMPFFATEEGRYLASCKYVESSRDFA